MMNWFTTILFDVEIVNLSTCQPIVIHTKMLQIRQFADSWRNWPYTKSRQSSKKGEMMNWFTTIIFGGEICLQDHWVKL